MSFTLKVFHSITSSDCYRNRHKKEAANFTRSRKLVFSSVLKFILCKSVKSLQLRLNEFSDVIDEQITASALCQARQKFSHTAFIELLDECVIKSMYLDDEYERYKGYRLLCVDGSTLRVPKSKDTLKHFGQSRVGDEKSVESKLSVVYDLLNRIPLKADVFPGRTNDIVACTGQLSILGEKDILIADRGYDSYGFFASILERNADFVVRCTVSRKIVSELMADSSKKEIVVSMSAPTNKQSDSSLPSELLIRFVRIQLSDGEVEVLATSLTDKKTFPYKVFKALYGKRWRIETYFQTLKGRLGLDNFSGKTKEAILQDVHATIFVSGLATILTEEASEHLAEKDTEYPQQVNNAVVFHSIKNKVIALMFEQPPDIQQQLLELFTINPTLVRKNRLKERNYNKRSGPGKTRSLMYQKNIRKHVF